MQDNHFNKIFWFLAATVAAAVVYIFAVTFLTIPKENTRFADTSSGIFLGTIITGVISYYIGATPPQQKKADNAPGTTTAEISGTITQNNVSGETKDKE